jgi:hypothetical protein
MHTLCHFAEGEIFPRERNIAIQQAFDDIPVVLALDSELVPPLAAQCADAPALSGKFVPPRTQATLAKIVDLVERRRLAIVARGALLEPALEPRDQAAISG